MNGAEVAGLVLGAFPLLISALEHYRECAEVIGCWRDIKGEYRDLKRRIGCIEVVYERTLDKLLFPLVGSDEELASLKAQPNSISWKEPTLERRLKARFAPSVKAYNLFLDTMSAMEETMKELQDKLGYDRSSFQARVVRLAIVLIHVAAAG